MALGKSLTFAAWSVSPIVGSELGTLPAIVKAKDLEILAANLV
jgi:hypothetical protein